jgi:hypothetical protein
VAFPRLRKHASVSLRFGTNPFLYFFVLKLIAETTLCSIVAALLVSQTLQLKVNQLRFRELTVSDRLVQLLSENKNVVRHGHE